jgi:ribosomal protein L2
MGIRHKPIQQVHVIDLFQILVKLHNQVEKINSTITLFKGRNRGVITSRHRGGGHKSFIV